jgi:hypothetical protein
MPPGAGKEKNKEFRKGEVRSCCGVSAASSPSKNMTIILCGMPLVFLAMLTTPLVTQTKCLVRTGDSMHS